MRPLNLLTSACRCCRYYKPEGRRGGTCQQLGVPVQGSWKACTLARPVFAPAWEGLEEMMTMSITSSSSEQQQVEPVLV